MAKTGGRETKSKKAKTPVSYEDVRSRLEEVVAKLERGEGTLEESLALYEEGVALVRSAHGMLDAAQKRLEVLKPQADGSFRLEDRTADFGGAGGPGGSEAEVAGGDEGDLE
ncbi:MAG: exodeoxyribonuclease VII small subunit [Planctomycetota bacterium]|jgi:exodeoxyribonuclease VII small subunit